MFWLALLLSLAWCSTVNAQPIETSGLSSNSNIEETLTRLRHNSQQLEKLLQQRKLKREQAERMVSGLLQELAIVRTALEESLQHSVNSEAEIQRLTNSLTLSQQTSTSLQTNFDEYVKSSDQAIRKARIQGAAIGGGVVAVIWVVIEIFKAIF